ncbi:MAG: hypothetical protein FJ279_32685, partial [Planctomycetes bacterium]|nr:hypothetical protein [Planctomycetota bacterium]
SEWFCHRIQVTDKYAFVPHGVKGVLVIDIANPSSPTIAGALPVKKLEGGAKFFLGENLGVDQWTRGAMVALNLVENMLYVNDYWDNIYALDVADLAHAKIRDKADAYYGWKMAIEGDRLYRARLDGLTVYTIPRPAEAPLGAVSTRARQ